MPQTTQQNQPLQILGLSQQADHTINITPQHAQGEIYLVLKEETDTQDEAWVEIKFTANINLDSCPDEYIDGYRYEQADVWIEDVYSIEWQVGMIDTNGEPYAPITGEQINDIIKEFILAQPITLRQVQEYYADC